MTNTAFYFSTEQSRNKHKFSHMLHDMIGHIGNRPIVFLCIGSDRATGDSLGPIVGQRIGPYLSENIFWHKKSFFQNKKTAVYGSLHQTVHAGNLADTLQAIQCRFTQPFIIAIDASLGIPEHIGYVTLGQGCLRPGIGVSQELPTAGDIHITGIVNQSSGNNHLTLQTTKLFTVMEMAAFIADGILEALHVRPSLQGTQKGNLIDIF